MSVEMPPALDWVAKLAVGQSWPKGDEDRLRGLGAAWDDAARELKGISEQLGSTGNGVLEAVGGRVADEFRAFVTQLEAAVPQMAESSQQMGKLGRHTGVQIEYSKYMILGQLVLLAGQIAQWAFFAPEVIPAAITSARVAVRMILRRLLISVAAGVALNLGLDAAVQTIQILKGDRTEWSLDNTRSAAISGAIGGAVGGVFFGVGGVVAPRFAGSLIGKGVLGAATGVTTAGIMLGAFGGEELLGASVAAGIVGSLGGGGRRRFGGKGDTVAVDQVRLDLPDRPVLDLSGEGVVERAPVPVPVTASEGPAGGGQRAGTDRPRPAAGGPGHPGGTPGAPEEERSAVVHATSTAARTAGEGANGRAAAVLPGFATAVADTGRTASQGGTAMARGTAAGSAGRSAQAGTGASAHAQAAGGVRVVGAAGSSGGAGRTAEAPSSAGHARATGRPPAAAPAGTPGAGAPVAGTPARLESRGSEARVAAPAVGTGRTADPTGVGRPATSAGPSAPGGPGAAATPGPVRSAAELAAAKASAPAEPVRTAAGPGPRPEYGPAREAEPTVATASAGTSSPAPASATASTAPAAAGPKHPTASTAPAAGALPRDRPRPPAPRMVLDRTPGFVVRSGFEARRFVYAGAPVTDLTVRIAFRDGGRGHDTASIWSRLVQGVEEHFNRPGHQLAGGDRLHVTVVPARPGEHAHLTVDLVGRDRGMDQRSWWPDAEPVDYAHELGHQLGLRDEYRAPDLPHRPAVEGSMMGDYHRPAPGGLPQAGLRERHLRLISAVVADLDVSGPAEGHHLSWDAARAAATPHSRAHAWADPVSDPLHRGRPTGSSAVAPRTHASPGDAGQGHGADGSAAPVPAAGDPAAASGSGSTAQPDASHNSVLMQPGYASGDQFGISVSLLHDPNMHVLIARGPEPGTPGHDPVQDKSRAIARFYRSAGIDAGRIHFVDVPSMEKRTVWRALNGEATRIAQQDWGIEKSYDEMYQQGEIWGVTDGTAYVGQVFSDGLRSTVRAAWGMTDAHDGRIGSWLEGRGIHLPPKDGKVLVLWSRFTGKATRWDDLRSRMEHDTSFQGIRQIVRDVGREYDAVIITGDPHPNPAKSDKWDDLVVQMRSELGTDTVHHITGFWKGRGEELTSWGGDTRTGQFLLYDALHRHYRLDHLGFRSGNLEAVALLGHRVSYLEEAGAGGAARMAQWHDSGNGLTRGGGLAPGYERVIVPEPPTASGRYAQQFDVDGFAQDGRGYQRPDPNAWWRKPAEVYGQERGFGTRELDDIRAQLGLPDASGARDRAGFFIDRVQHLRRKYETVRAEVVRLSGGGPQVEAYLSGYDRYFRTAPDQYHAGPEQLYHDLVEHGLPHLPQLWQYSRNLAYQAYAQQATAHGQPSSGGHPGGDGLAPRAPASDSTGAATGQAAVPTTPHATGHAAGTVVESPAGPSAAHATPGPEGPTPAGDVRSVNDVRSVGPDLARERYGLPEKNFGKFRQLARERNLVIDVRPTNTEAPKWLDRGMLPKPKDIKAKTVNELDVHLGADREHVGLVGYFEPVRPAREGLDEATWGRVEARYRQRAHEFAELAPVMRRLESEGRFRVEHGLVLGEDGHGGWRAITGDHDVFDISTPGGSRLTPTRYDGVVGEMMANDMAVMHGAHSYWSPQSPFSKSIFAKINASHLPGGEPLVRFRPDSDRAELVHAAERPEHPASDGPPAGMADPAEVAPRAPMTTGEHDQSGGQQTAHTAHSGQPAGPAAGPATEGHAFRYAEGAVEPDAVHFARADALAAELVRAAVGRAESGLPLPRITVTGHGNGTVAGQPHFGRAMQIGKERAEALADLLVERIATHLGGHDTRLTTADLEVRTRSRGQLAPLGTDPAHLTAEERRQAVVTLDHPEPEPAAAAPADLPDGGTGGTVEARANAVRHGLGAETVDYLFGDGPRPAQTVAAIGEHPSWVEDRALGRWAAGVAMTPKYETLVALNRLTRSGEGPQGDSLLYLGANADVEHPLFTTRATRMTLIGVDPENLDAVTRKAHLDQVVGVMERNLRGYATPGHTVVRAETEPGRVTRLTVEGPDGPVLTVDYHAVTYDEYLHANPAERFEVVMDKDSWLLEWRSEQGVADAVHGLLAEGGSWIGGTELGAPADARFTQAPAERLGVGDPKWSGYQDLRLRTRTDRPAEPAAAPASTSASTSDPTPTASTSAAAGAGSATEAGVGELFKGVMVAARDRFAFRGWTFDEAAYTSMLDDDLAYSLPYHHSFAGDEASVLANALALLPGVAQRLSAEISTFAGTDGDFGPRRILRDFAVLLDLDPDVLAPPPTGATGEEGA